MTGDELDLTAGSFEEAVQRLVDEGYGREDAERGVRFERGLEGPDTIEVDEHEEGQL